MQRLLPLPILIRSPEQQLGTMKAGVLSPTGTCHTFDDTADGYGRADGVGALYIKKLSKAIADGDSVRSIIHGTAVNSNGKTPGINLPSTDGQEAVIRKAYVKAGLTDFGTTDYIECHGTGIPVSDRIEVKTVARIFERNLDQMPLLVGSESIFTTMSSEAWHTSVKPKVRGSWNLHNAIKGKDDELDFFVMTSPVAGSVGTATEGNYTAADSFLDSFAKYRRRQGLPATSIGLGMISEGGYTRTRILKPCFSARVSSPSRRKKCSRSSTSFCPDATVSLLAKPMSSPVLKPKA